MTRILDLSVPVAATPSEATPVEVRVWPHETAAAAFGLQPDDLPDGVGLSNETISLTTHTGTHVDAPLHYGPAYHGQPARSIDDVPLEWCIGRGLRLDMRSCEPGASISAIEVEAAWLRVGRNPEPGDIVLLWTGADELWGTSRYLTDYPGLSREGTACLLERGVRVIGTDGWGLDRPAPAMVADYRRTRDSAVLWPAHFEGRRHEYLQVEKLANLGQLPDCGSFDVCCFPVKIAGAGAAWTRAVALLW